MVKVTTNVKAGNSSSNSWSCNKNCAGPINEAYGEGVVHGCELCEGKTFTQT